MNLNEKDITSVAEFTEYAKEVLKKAHGDNYDDGIAQETIDGLVSKYGEDYGAMIGALTNGLGEELNEGKIDWSEADYGDSALVKKDNKMGVILKPYGRKFHLQFADDTEKTYDRSELEFYKNESKLNEGFKKTSNWFELGGSELKDIKRAIESKIGRVTVELNDLGNYEFLGKDAIAFVGEGEYEMYRVSLYTLDHDIIFDDEGNDLGSLINKLFLNESKLNEGKELFVILADNEPYEVVIGREEAKLNVSDYRSNKDNKGVKFDIKPYNKISKTLKRLKPESYKELERLKGEMEKLKESKLNEGGKHKVGKRYGDFAITKLYADAIKFVHQETMMELFVYIDGNKYETSFHRRRIIERSLDKLMAQVLKIEAKSKLNEAKMPTFKKPRNIKMDDEIYQQLADAIYKSVSYLGADMIENSLPLNTANLWKIIRYATNRIWMTDDNANLRSGRHGIKHDDEWLVKRRKYTDLNFESAAKSILKTMFGKKVVESKLNEGSVSDKTKAEIKLLKSKGYEIDSYSDSISDLIFSTPNEEEFINATQGSKGKNKFAIAYFYRDDEDGDMMISRDLLKAISSSFGKNDEIIIYSNAGVDLHSSEKGVFGNVIFKRVSHDKFNESKLNEGKKMQFEDVKVGFFTGTYKTIWGGDGQVESEMDYLNMEVADELKEMFGELDFIGFEFEYDDFNWEFEELFQEIPEYVSASFEELLSDIGIDGNVGKSRMVSPRFYNYGTDEIFCNITIDYDLIEEAIADLVEEDDDYSLLRDLTRNNNTAYIYTNYGELESDLMKGDSLALEVLIQVLSEVKVGDEYEVRDEYEMSAYEEWRGNTFLGRTVSGNLEFRLENEIDDEEVVAKIVKHIEDNV